MLLNVAVFSRCGTFDVQLFSLKSGAIDDLNQKDWHKAKVFFTLPSAAFL